MSLLQYQRPEGTSTYDGQSFSRAVPLVPSKTMPWQRKAAIARLCAALPFGGRAYQFLQRKFGRLTSDPSLRLPTAAKFARWVFDAGGSVEGANVLEVGTGHKPIVAI